MVVKHRYSLGEPELTCMSLSLMIGMFKKASKMMTIVMSIHDRHRKPYILAKPISVGYIQ